MGVASGPLGSRLLRCVGRLEVVLEPTVKAGVALGGRAVQDGHDAAGNAVRGVCRGAQEVVEETSSKVTQKHCSVHIH